MLKLRKNEGEQGITLIALVITIIVLLILAGVSIAMLTGDNGILTQANNATVQQSHGSVREGIALAYNEYQIEINTASNTKLASIEIVQIQGKEEKSLATTYTSFLDFLSKKGYADATTGIINVEALTGSKQALGNGTNTDVYKVEEENGMYVVNYYDEDNQKEEIWNIVNNDNEGDSSKHSVENVDFDLIGLKDLQTNDFTTFLEAYIVYNDERIDISTCIIENTYIASNLVKNIVSINNGDTVEIIIVKDGKSYSGEVKLSWPL